MLRRLILLTIVVLFAGCVRNDVTGDEPSTCRVHSVALETITVPVAYGAFPALSEKYRTAKDSLFAVRYFSR